MKKKIKLWILGSFSDDDLRDEMSSRNYGVVRGDVFRWMDNWLKAYDRANDTNHAEKIKDWINNQPMSAS